MIIVQTDRQTDTLWISSTNHLKALAILMVIISHYCRYVVGRTDVFTQCLGGIGFLGAALFAFLSGYGVCTSLKRKGMRSHWLNDKFNKVYLPFVVINVISYIFIYDTVSYGQERFVNTDINIVQDLLWCGYDFVQWYVPYIMMFYLFVWLTHFVLKEKNEKYHIFFIFASIVAAFQIIVGMILQISSNWYTSTGALLAGIYLADKENMSKSSLWRYHSALYLILIVIFILLLGVSQLSNIRLGKEICAILSGSLFSVLMFYGAFRIQQILEGTIYMRIMQIIGNASLWIYMLHFKVIYALNPISWVMLPSVMAITLLLSIICNNLWKKAIA